MRLFPCQPLVHNACGPTIVWWAHTAQSFTLGCKCAPQTSCLGLALLPMPTAVGARTTTQTQQQPPCPPSFLFTCCFSLTDSAFGNQSQQRADGLHRCHGQRLMRTILQHGVTHLYICGLGTVALLASHAAVRDSQGSLCTLSQLQRPSMQCNIPRWTQNSC